MSHRRGEDRSGFDMGSGLAEMHLSSSGREGGNGPGDSRKTCVDVEGDDDLVDDGVFDNGGVVRDVFADDMLADGEVGDGRSDEVVVDKDVSVAVDEVGANAAAFANKSDTLAPGVDPALMIDSPNDCSSASI